MREYRVRMIMTTSFELVVEAKSKAAAIAIAHETELDSFDEAILGTDYSAAKITAEAQS